MEYLVSFVSPWLATTGSTIFDPESTLSTYSSILSSTHIWILICLTSVYSVGEPYKMKKKFCDTETYKIVGEPYKITKKVSP